MINKVDIVVVYTNIGVPITGLTPQLRLYETRTKSIIIDEADMDEVGDGAYTYLFQSPTYDPRKSYFGICDGGDAQVLDSRYQFVVNGPSVDDLRKMMLNKMKLVEEDIDNNYTEYIYEDDDVTIAKETSIVRGSENGKSIEQREEV